MENAGKKTSSPTRGGFIGKLYESRRANLGGLDSRNRLTGLYAGTIILLLTAAFMWRSRSTENWQKFAKTTNEISFLSTENFFFKISQPELLPCDHICQSTPQNMSLTKPLLPSADLLLLNHLPENPVAANRAPDSQYDPAQPRIWSQIQLLIPIPASQIAQIKSSLIYVAMPSLRYRMAFVQLDGVPYGSFADSERIILKLPLSKITDQFLNIQIKINLPDTGFAVDTGYTQTPPYVASPRAAKNLEKFLLLDRDTRGSVMSVMSRVLIAFFALFIFVVIDSTPESFGLAMFLGFEALAIVLGERWIEVPWSKFFVHTSYQMGDIFRLYFFIQISRMFRPNTSYWLFAGTILSIPYGYLRFVEGEWGISGLEAIPRMRDATAGSIGTVLCLMSLYSIRKDPLPWRKIALTLASLCSFQQVLGPILFYVPELNQSANFRQFFTSYETLSVYLGALSALTNMSTLEHRVKRLSLAKAHGDMIEQELSLGQTVQRSFLSRPKLPPELEIAHVHEAAVYVSGDIIYSHYDDDTSNLTLLVCDLTGHGVQAALKATACYMLARNVWDIKVGNRSEQGSANRFEVFRKEQDQLMRQFSDTPDIPTFSAIEFDSNTAAYSAYRSNFNVPLVVEKGFYGGWKVRCDILPDGLTKQFQIDEENLIVLLSDGYIASSRHLSKLIKFLEKNFSGFDGTPQGLCELIQAFNEQNTDRPQDDRTVLAVAYKRKRPIQWNIAQSIKHAA
jgi:hypothetical protein